MSDSLGKKFERKFCHDWQTSFPNSVCLRLPDQQSGYKGSSQNICDFVCFAEKRLFLVECKTTKDGTFSFSKLTQYSRLSPYVGLPDVCVGVLIWFYNKDKIVFCPLQEITRAIANGKKSVSVKWLNSGEYAIIEIPSKKRRTFFDSDYTVLANFPA